MDKFPGIGGTHSKQPHIEKQSDERVAGHLVLHEQNKTVWLHYPAHFIQSFLSCFSLEFIERVGKGNRVKTGIWEGQLRSMPREKS
jgi:hypothetical protein